MKPLFSDWSMKSGKHLVRVVLILGMNGCSSGLSSQSSDIQTLKSDYENLQTTSDGALYEERAVQAFFEKNFSAVQLCAPPDAPLEKPFSIFLTVDREGAMSSMTFEPETEVTRCLLRKVVPVKFARPSRSLPERIVVRIDMVFEE